MSIFSCIFGSLAAWAETFQQEQSETVNFTYKAPRLADMGIQLRNDAANVIHYNQTVAQPKSQWVAMGYAILPGYIIPAAFGHAYAEAKVQATIISGARLSGRIMWMYSFFDNFWVDGSEGSIDDSAKTLFFVGLALDLGGYLYDIIHSPIEVASYNRRFFSNNQKRVTPFIDMADDGPCCGLAFLF